MSFRIVPYGTDIILKYTDRLLKVNPDYTQDDIEWLKEFLIRNYSLLIENPYKMYMFLTLINGKIFSGYFSYIFNFNLNKSIKDRNYSQCFELVLNPTFEEVFENDKLSEKEKTHLLNNTSLEILSTNLTIKKLTLYPSKMNQIHDIFDESYMDLYSKIYHRKVKHNRSGFQDFILVTEHNPITQTNHVHTYKLLNIILQCINDEFSDKLTSNTITDIKKRFEIEIKMVQYTYSVLSKL